ncbi:MAG: hypothetical protein ACFB6R_07190 [Alphaproteobacteria bacterium]
MGLQRRSAPGTGIIRVQQDNAVDDDGVCAHLSGQSHIEEIELDRLGPPVQDALQIVSSDKVTAQFVHSHDHNDEHRLGPGARILGAIQEANGLMGIAHTVEPEKTVGRGAGLGREREKRGGIFHRSSPP